MKLTRSRWMGARLKAGGWCRDAIPGTPDKPTAWHLLRWQNFKWNKKSGKSPRNAQKHISLGRLQNVWHFGQVQARPARSLGWSASEAILGPKGHGPVYCEVIIRPPSLVREHHHLLGTGKPTYTIQLQDALSIGCAIDIPNISCIPNTKYKKK